MECLLCHKEGHTVFDCDSERAKTISEAVNHVIMLKLEYFYMYGNRTIESIFESQHFRRLSLGDLIYLNRKWNVREIPNGTHGRSSVAGVDDAISYNSRLAVANFISILKAGCSHDTKNLEFILLCALLVDDICKGAKTFSKEDLAFLSLAIMKCWYALLQTRNYDYESCFSLLKDFERIFVCECAADALRNFQQYSLNAREEEVYRNLVSRAQRLDAKYPGSTFERDLRSFGDYVVLVSGALVNLSRDWDIVVDLIARERAMRTLDVRLIAPHLALAIQRRFLQKRIGFFIARGWAQHIIERWRSAVSLSSTAPSFENEGLFHGVKKQRRFQNSLT
jgi:hypothetical protein